jgi:AhpD family alkylhydroperoxidase
MANNPTQLKSYLALFGAVATATIPAAVRARLAIATAQLNRCQSCLSSHTDIGAHTTKVDASELENARTDQSNDPHAAALLTLSNTLAQNAGDLDEADNSAARQAGATEEQIGELAANHALNTMTNYPNDMTHVDNNWPVISL